MMMVKNIFGEYVAMNEEDVEELLIENKRLVEELTEVKMNINHMKKAAEVSLKYAQNKY